MSTELKVRLPHPIYDNVTYEFQPWGFKAWEFNGWPKETLSWKQGCYIHAGLSGGGPISIKGPDARKYLESLCINSFADFPIGSMKHVVECNEDGLIESHGIIERIGEEHYTSYAGGPPAFHSSFETSFDVEIKYLDYYNFQIAGPTSRALLEKLTEEDLGDLKFLYLKNSKLAGKYVSSGKDIPVEIARIGMARTLAYELHGPMADAAAVYEAVFNVGKEFGIERLGWDSYWVNHTEGGFPQNSGHFLTPSMVKMFPSTGSVSGSVNPHNMRARFRTPVEVGWGNLAKPDHDYIGRAAVEAELTNPRRTTVTLRWNAEDVLDVWASLLKPGEAYPPLTIPSPPYKKFRGGHQDLVLKDNREVGYSSGIVYSYYFREYLSLGCIDLDVSALGTELKIRWGDYGGPYKDIRAIVAPLPYISKGKFGQLDSV